MDLITTQTLRNEFSVILEENVSCWNACNFTHKTNWFISFEATANCDELLRFYIQTVKGID